MQGESGINGVGEEQAALDHWDGAVEVEDPTALAMASELANFAEGPAAENHVSDTFFYEISCRRFFPGLVLTPSEEKDRLIRKEIWARFGQPMHFISLDFDDEVIEYGFQVDATRRNKHWVRRFLVPRAAVNFLYALYFWMVLNRESSNASLWPSQIVQARYWFNVFYPAISGAVFVLQYLHVRFDSDFVERRFQHVMFFWSLVHVIGFWVFVAQIAPNVYDHSRCDSTWETLGSISVEDITSMQNSRSGIDDQFIKLILTTQVLFRLRSIFFVYVNVGMFLALFLLTNPEGWSRTSPCLPTWGDMRYLVTISVGFLFISYVFELMQRKDFIQGSAVFEERQKSNELLENVLPRSIVQELKQQKRGVQTETSIVQNYETVSVLFADIVSFTTMSARLSPNQLVNLLDQLFLIFDDLAERNNLEKIKTIGDCYMAAGGVPVASATHARDIARMGLQMIQAMTEASLADPVTQAPLRVRVGIHSGPVVAGVIGHKKFLYDLWGDAVNTASRMESHGQPMRVHCSADTHAFLQSNFELENNGVMQVKGKGEMHTYFVLREKADADLDAHAVVDGLPVVHRKSSLGDVSRVEYADHELEVSDHAAKREQQSGSRPRGAGRFGSDRSQRSSMGSTNSQDRGVELGQKLPPTLSSR